MRRAETLETERGKPKKRKMDPYIVLCTLGILIFGIVMVYSASYYTQIKKGDNAASFLIKQLVGGGLGVFMMLILSRIDYHIFAKKVVAYSLVVISVVLLLLVFVPHLGMTINGSSRWINIPVFGSLQSSEVAKFSLVVFLAYHMSEKRWWYTRLVKGWLPVLAVIAVFAGLIIKEPNLSTTICVGCISLVMFAIGGAQKRYMGLIGLVVASGGFAYTMTKDYAHDRYLAFMDPFKYKGDQSFQLVHSLYAFGDGGLFGVGIGMSKQKNGSLPMAESDFILPIIGEELGLIGCLVLLAAFGLLIFRGMRVAITAPDRFGTLLAGGITSIVAIQVIINTAVVTGCAPTTGLPLPFISAGNSSILIMMAMMGVLLNISRQARQ